MWTLLPTRILTHSAIALVKAFDEKTGMVLRDMKQIRYRVRLGRN